MAFDDAEVRRRSCMVPLGNKKQKLRPVEATVDHTKTWICFVGWLFFMDSTMGFITVKNHHSRDFVPTTLSKSKKNIEPICFFVGCSSLRGIIRSCIFFGSPVGLGNYELFTYKYVSINVFVFCAFCENSMRVEFLSILHQPKEQTQTKQKKLVLDNSGQIIATSAEVTLNGGLVKESPTRIPLIQV